MGRGASAEQVIAPAAQTRESALAELEAELLDADRTAARSQCYSSVAARHPDHNEDRVICDPERGLAAVIDGMGGHADGELAAAVAAGAISGVLSSEANEDLPRERLLQMALAEARNAIRVLVHGAHESNGDAVAVLASIEPGRVQVCSVGDARAYLLGVDGELRQLTEDDDVLEISQLQGRFSEQERREAREQVDRARSKRELTSPAARTLFRGRATISASITELRQTPWCDSFECTGDELLILTSDGVHDNLSFDEIRQICAARRGEGPDALVRAVHDAARERSEDRQHDRAKDDDISICCLRCHDPVSSAEPAADQPVVGAAARH